MYHIFIYCMQNLPHKPTPGYHCNSYMHTAGRYSRSRTSWSRDVFQNASVLSHADDRIGEVLDTLDRLDLTENTLVIFGSDNGRPGPRARQN